MRNAVNTLFGQRVRYARKRIGLTQAALGSRVSLDRTTVAGIESGRQGVQLEVLIDLADALGCSPADLLPTKNELMTADSKGEETLPPKVRSDEVGAAFLRRVSRTARSRHER